MFLNIKCVICFMELQFSVENIKQQFPIFQRPNAHGKRLIWLDNASTTQKPQCVINAIVDYYTCYNSNIHRGIYEFSEKASMKYEEVRSKVANYFGVHNLDEIVFVRGATEGINLVASSYCRKFLKKDDEILIGAAEHHANYLPWQVLDKEIGVCRKIIPLTNAGDIDLDAYEKLFTKKTKFVAVQYISNVLGSKNDIGLLTTIAHNHGAKILIDGASALNVCQPQLDSVDCDFFVCSGHKGFGPTGSGFLFGKYSLLEQMVPYQTGGDMVNKVTFEESTFKNPPYRFEAGTPDVAAVIGMGVAIDFLLSIDHVGAQKHLKMLTDYLTQSLRECSNIMVYGDPIDRSGIVSFNMNGCHPHDVATFLANDGIAVRAGTHCAQPLMELLSVPGTVRVSLAIYNTIQDIDDLMTSIDKVQKWLFR